MALCRTHHLWLHHVPGYDSWLRRREKLQSLSAGRRRNVHTFFSPPFHIWNPPVPFFGRNFRPWHDAKSSVAIEAIFGAGELEQSARTLSGNYLVDPSDRTSSYDARSGDLIAYCTERMDVRS